MTRTYLGQLFLVGLGGFVGAGARFIVSGLVHRIIPQATFPHGTLVVNLLGCLAIGILGGLMEIRQVLDPAQRIFLVIGVLGSFTTFSTFAFETLSLAHSADVLKVGINVAGHVIGGLLIAWVGYVLVQQL